MSILVIRAQLKVHPKPVPDDSDARQWLQPKRSVLACPLQNLTVAPAVALPLLLFCISCKLVVFNNSVTFSSGGNSTEA